MVIRGVKSDEGDDNDDDCNNDIATRSMGPRLKKASSFLKSKKKK